jgi:hypothetical protein
MSKPRPARYRTTNWSIYNAALRKRGSSLIWLDKEMAWHAPHEGRPGRAPVFSDAGDPVLPVHCPAVDSTGIKFLGDGALSADLPCKSPAG